MTLATAPTTETSADYCDCPRQGDMWRCPTGGGAECQPGTGKGCALYATLMVTGQAGWDRDAESQLKARPCPCGSRRRAA